METLSTPRSVARNQWLINQGWKDFTIQAASADASFRSYWRGPGMYKARPQCHILMDAPPAQENSKPFVEVAALLREAGLHSPQIYAEDIKMGFLLLEDLGSIDFADLEPAARESHYQDALNALLQAQSISCEALPAYTKTLLHDEMQLFSEWLLGKHLAIAIEGEQAQQWNSTLQLLCDNALEQPQVFVHRDYHSRNLMVTQYNSPGIVDFQDAVRGPITYDLVSLLRDCYWRCPTQLRDALLGQFIQSHQAQGIDAEPARWRRWFDLMGVQRHLKASGIFCRLHYRDGKSNYLNDIPLTLNYVIEVTSDYQELHYLGRLLTNQVMPQLTDHSL